MKKDCILINNIKMLSTMGYNHLKLAKKRKEYAYGNKKHSVRESRKEVYKLTKYLANRMIKAANMDLKVIGRENLPTEGPVLYIANHKSIFDIVVLVSTIEDPCIFLAKKEVAKMQMINTWFAALGAIYIDRDDKRKALESIIHGVNELRSGQSIVAFPEGTRVSGDKIKEFKGGCFKLATKTGVPIVPIAIHNTYKVFEEKKGIQSATVTLNIGKPIEVKQLNKEDIKILPSMVETVVRDLMQEIIDK